MRHKSALIVAVAAAAVVGSGWLGYHSLKVRGFEENSKRIVVGKSTVEDVFAIMGKPPSIYNRFPISTPLPRDVALVGLNKGDIRGWDDDESTVYVSFSGSMASKIWVLHPDDPATPWEKR